MELSYDREGDGAPVLLVHGLGGTKGLWAPVMERLRVERDVIALDLPGFGASPGLPAGVPATAPNLAERVAELSRSLGLSDPHVVGNSLGAWVALEMAKRGEAGSVLGISPAGLWRDALGPRRVERQRLGRRIRPLLRATLASRRGRGLLLSTSVAHPDRVPADAARAMVLSYVDAPGYESANAEMRASAFEHSGKVDVPVTLVWGESDRIVGRPSSSRIPPGAAYFTVPGWGHTPTWDDPAGVAELVLASDHEQASPEL